MLLLQLVTKLNLQSAIKQINQINIVIMKKTQLRLAQQQQQQKAWMKIKF